MKIMKYLTIGILFIGMATLVSCKKEDKIGRNLWNKGGVWNVEKFQNNYSFYGTSDSDILYNIGTFEFNKDGSGKLNFNVDGEIYIFI